MLLAEASPPSIVPRREDKARRDTHRAPDDRRTAESSLPLPRIHLMIRSQAVSERRRLDLKEEQRFRGTIRRWRLDATQSRIRLKAISA